MADLGFRPVGKEFPVFLHPDTQEEYALARTEKKIAKGYQGFSFNTAVDVTLEQDLARRDLTVNAIAKSPDGEIIDPFNGRADIESETLRHVSGAFTEDPVRVLRAARFSARLGFRIAADTKRLMQEMSRNGEVDALVPERVWTETVKALMAGRPWLFISVLRDCGALARVFPRDRCAIRRTTAGAASPRNRYRDTYTDGTGAGRASFARTRGEICRTGTRPRQGRHTEK